MTGLALVLVLSSAVLHATWNYYAKRVGGGAGFIWLSTVIQVVVYAPLALFVVVREQPMIGPAQVVAIVGTAILNVAYFLLLSRGYRTGDLSLVYPLARGTGPMLSTAAAILLLGERPTPLALGGAVLIGVGVFILTGDPRKFRESGAGRAVVYALLTGLIIATYTLWDKRSVSVLLIPPLLYDWSNGFTRTLLLAPYALRHKAEVVCHWREHRTAAMMVGILSPLSYIMFCDTWANSWAALSPTLAASERSIPIMSTGMFSTSQSEIADNCLCRSGDALAIAASRPWRCRAILRSTTIMKS